MKEKVVLAFSGGLDTSFCVKYLALEKNLAVHAATVQTGGFSEEDLTKIKHRANELGVADFVVLNETQEFYEKCIRYLVYGNVLRNNTYPLSVSAERVFQAMAVVKYARKIGAKYIAHGSTGAGNDQVRFDIVFQIMAPDIEVITPIRDLKLSREAEIDYLTKAGVSGDWTKAKYSINQGLWGTSVGGVETLTSAGVLPEEAYPSQLEVAESTQITLHFEKGQIVGLDDVKFGKPVEIITKINDIAKKYAIGRGIHVGDTIIGIKGRVGFQAPAPLIIIKAHHLLEKHTLTKWQMYWKDSIANTYGMMLHEGQYLEPLMRNFETFMESTQDYVSGSVQVKLAPYYFETLGCTSPHDLMSAKFGSYGEMNRTWSGDDVKGFTKIFGNQTSIFYQVNDLIGK